MARELIGAEPSCAAAGQNSTLFMAENTSQTWPPQLCWAQPDVKSTVEWGGLFKSLSPLLPPDTFPWSLSSTQQPHLSVTGFQACGWFYQRHGLPSLVLPPLHSLSSSLWPICASLNFFFHWLFQSTQVPEWPTSPPGLPQPWPMAQTC